MERKIKIMIVQRIFAHYRKTVFDELNRIFELYVVHSKDNSGIKQIKTDYSIEVKKISLFGSFNRLFLFMFKPIFQIKPDIIIHEFSMGIFSLPLVYLLTRLLGIKLVLWSHGYNRRKGFMPEKRISDRVRIFYIKLSDALLLYGDKDKELFSKYIDKDKIFVAKNTFDTSNLLNFYDDFTKKGVELLKKDKGFKHKFNLIFIGRMIKSKEPELLVKIYEAINERFGGNIGIHYIGDGEEKDRISSYVKEKGFSNNFFFHGAIYDERTIGELLFCSDLMVLPGECGLSVVHALSFGTPVVTFKSDEKGPFHGPEIEYVIDSKTGFLIEKGNLNQMSETIINYLNDKEKQSVMRKYIIEFVRNELSVENMVNGFKRLVESLTEK